MNYSRRNFLKTSAVLSLGTAITSNSLAAILAKSGSIALIVDTKDKVASAVPPTWAIGELKKAMEEQGSKVRIIQNISETKENEFCILISGMNAPLAKSTFKKLNITNPDVAESLCIVQSEIENRKVLVVSGFDELGLVYALTELADRVKLIESDRDALEFKSPVIEKPASRTRSILRHFSSELEDKPWFYDIEYWKNYLDILVSSRVNRLNFSMGMGYNSVINVSDGYMIFPYPFFVNVPGYNVTAKGLSDEERAKNLETLKYIGEETTKRGLRFQFGIWTLAYKWVRSPNATYTIEGLTDETHGDYCRKALAILLSEVPTISGVTFRVHEESGIPKGQGNFWKTQFSAIEKCGRKVEIDMHAKNMEAQTLQSALETNQPVVVSPKFCGEHLGLPYHSSTIREKEMPDVDKLVDTGEGLLVGNRKFTRYGYADMLSENRTWDVVFRIWPGTQRFLLNGDSATFAGYGRIASFCGAAGIELSEPLMFKGRKGTGTEGGRCAYLDKTLNPRYDFEKYAYTYRLWGRLGYNPDSNPEVWQRALKPEFGSAAVAIENALASATRVLPLFYMVHTPSGDCARYWPEIYTNLPMAVIDPKINIDTRDPKLFGNVSPMDTQIFQFPDESADAILNGAVTGKYSSIEVSQWFDSLVESASVNIQKAHEQLGNAASKPNFRRVEEDVLIQIGMAKFFAAKLRSAVLWRVFSVSGNKEAGKLAVEKYTEGLNAWKTMAERAKSIYIGNITYGVHGNWFDRIPSFEKDIAEMSEQIANQTEPTNKPNPESVDRAIKLATSKVTRPIVEAVHKPEESFLTGKGLPIAIGISQDVHKVKLNYRHVDQSEYWQSVEMKQNGKTYTGNIPSDYTTKRFPLQYYFEIETSQSQATLYPALAADLANVPYFVVRRKI